MMRIKLKSQEDKYKITVMAGLLGVCCFLTYYFHAVLKTGTVFTHFCYIPIILASLWWRRKGLAVAVFLGFFLIFSHIFLRETAAAANDYFRAFMFIVIAFVVAMLSEQIAKAEAALQRYSKELELKVKERTKELTKQRDYTRHLMESSPDFQVTLDRNDKILDVNEAFEKIIRKNREVVVGTSIYEYFPKEETEKIIAEIFEKKQLRHIKLNLNIAKKGTLICDFSGTVFTTQEGELGIYVSGRDVTEITRLQEEELKAKDIQLIHAARLSTLGEMATAMAHEINQPLTIISVAAEGVSRDIKKKRLDMSLLYSDLEEILDNVKRIDRIITHMRTFARQPEELEFVEPEKLLDNAFVMLGEQLRVHDILISRKTEKNLPVIKVDPNQLEQVFINILINARQVLDIKGGEAKKEGKDFQKQLVCSISREDDYVVFEFADNACGVPDEIKMRIFEPFFTTKETGQGTGLGLSIAYNIVTCSLGGKVWVEDNEIGGASFKIVLPVEK